MPELAAGLDDPTGANMPPEAPRPKRYSTLFFVLFCLEIGIVLLLMPWTPLWDGNYFFSVQPEWGDLWLNTWTRGAVSGIGIINLKIGLGELWRFWR